MTGLSTTSTPQSRQRQFIADARALLRPGKVRPSMPNWFRLAFLRTFPGAAGGTAAGDAENMEV